MPEVVTGEKQAPVAEEEIRGPLTRHRSRGVIMLTPGGGVLLQAIYKKRAPEM